MDGGSETIPGYTYVGDSYDIVSSWSYLDKMTNLYAGGSNVSRIGNQVGNLYYYASAGSYVAVKEYPNEVHRVGTTVKTVGTQYSEAYVPAEGTSSYVLTGVPTQRNDLYITDSSKNRTVNKRGSTPSVTLYYRDSDNDRTVTPIGSAPPYTMYYRNEDHDSTVRVIGEQLTFNYADITTQQITGLVATS